MLVAIDAPPSVLPAGALKGMHGYLPTMPGMATGFIAAGPGVRRGAELPVVRQVDVAPTAPDPGCLREQGSRPGAGDRRASACCEVGSAAAHPSAARRR